MSDATTAAAEIPAKTGESGVEKPKRTIDAAVESGDVSGVYRIARSSVDDEVSRGLNLSKIEDANTATIAGPEIVALKQADASFQSGAEAALGKLKDAMGTGSAEVAATPKAETDEEKDARLNAVAEKAMTEGPLTVAEMAADLQKHEEAIQQKELSKITPEEAAAAIPLVKKKEDPVITIEELKPEEQKEVEEIAAMGELDEDIARGVGEFEHGLEKIDAELTAEKKALEEFNGTHGTAHTPLEHSYLGALQNRITALEFEKKTHETGDTSFEAKAKSAELKQLADKAEAAYQAMYDSFMKQGVDTAPAGAATEKPAAQENEKAGGLHLDEEDMNYEARQYEQFHPGQTFGGRGASTAKERPVFDTGSGGAEQKPKGRVGKFIDTLKFWKYLTGEQK